VWKILSQADSKTERFRETSEFEILGSLLKPRPTSSTKESYACFERIYVSSDVCVCAFVLCNISTRQEVVEFWCDTQNTLTLPHWEYWEYIGWKGRERQCGNGPHPSVWMDINNLEIRSLFTKLRCLTHIGDAAHSESFVELQCFVRSIYLR